MHGNNTGAASVMVECASRRKLTVCSHSVTSRDIPAGLAASSMTARFFSRLTACLFLLTSGLLARAEVERVAIDHAYVTTLARQRAAAAYQPLPTAPRYFRDLNYDDYRRIVFNPKLTLWRENNLPYQVQFFHPGYLFHQMITVNEFTGTHAQAVPFGKNLFDYKDLDLPLFSRWGLNFAGLRVLHPLNKPGIWDELISFLGTNYYRALGKNQSYGISARGLALNAGGPGPEEFPAFREFWIGKPDADSAALTLHALLDGPSVAAAYTFVVKPGEATVVEVRATFFFRQPVATPGFAPLSSMFWFGEASATRFGDYRDEVHDSDGLLIAPDAHTRLWRPLSNPTALVRSDFATTSLAGFGLLQRDRHHGSYVDLESHYERRPGVWIEPIGSWPPGFVRLVELPTRDEYQDNITAYWSPRHPPPVGQPLDLSWRQHWSMAPSFGGPPGWVSATRQTLQDGAPDRTLYIVDFDADSLASVPADAPLTPHVELSGGARVIHSQVVRNPTDGSRRLMLRVQAAPGQEVVEIRAQLLLDKKPLTEIWTTRWQR